MMIRILALIGLLAIVWITLTMFVGIAYLVLPFVAVVAAAWLALKVACHRR